MIVNVRKSVTLLLLVGAGSALTAACAEENGDGVLATEPIIAQVEAPASGWSRLEIANLNTFPLDEQPRFNARTRTFFKGPGTGQLIHAIFQPTWTAEMPKAGLGSHYHTFWEWGYTLKGDSTLAEPVSPYQQNGVFYRKREGGWLTRPPYSLHGGSWETGGKRAQLPYHLLIFEEGDGSLITVGPNGDHFFPEYPDRKPDPYVPDWKAVKQFARPWLIDSLRDLEWESDPNVEGRFIKWLDDDIANGFRAQLVKISPNWTPPKDGRGEYFKQANRLRYVIYGDMKVWLFDGADDESPQAVTVTEDYFIYQPPKSIWGYGEGDISTNGAIWLEVTYAHGVAHGGGPIEEPVIIE